MTKSAFSGWAAFSIALTMAAGAGAVGMTMWQMRPESRLRAIVLAADQAVKERKPKAAWTQIESLRAVNPWAADYYQARLLMRSPELAAPGAAPGQSAQLLRRAASAPKYADRARVALAELLMDHPELARSPDEAMTALRSAAQSGNRKAAVMLAGQLTQRPDSDKMEVLRLLTEASETNAGAAKTLVTMIEGRSLPVKSRALTDDIRYRQFTSSLYDAKGGDLDAMVRVGDAYRTGAGVAKDIALASEWYNRAAGLNSNTARMRQIDVLRLEGTPESAQKAHSLALDAAKDATSVGALTELGLDFKTGRGVPADLVKAESYFRRAAAMGSASAKYELADMLLKRQPSKPQDEAEAVAMLTDAAQMGNPGASWVLYGLYDKGQRGLTADPARAFAYLSQAAKGGRTAARTELASRYSSGDAVVARNEGEAFRWAGSALDSGATSTNLLLIMADGYARGEVVTQDRLRAKGYLEAAVRRGSPRAMRKLGALYFTLQQPDASQQAVKWLREASRHGETDAYIDLGRAYASGAGVPVDAARAFTFFEEAADAGNLTGLIEMGRSYATGYGVARNPQRAAELFLRAANAGSAEAMIMLSYSYEVGDGVPQSLPEARAWLKRGADSGDAEAQYWYGLYMLDGRGGPADRAGALALFEQSKAGKFKPAGAILNQMKPKPAAPKPVAPVAPQATPAPVPAAQVAARPTASGPGPSAKAKS
ncbi:sel1 repeat family protein [Asticcacaulis biprosthecium C19]|uniref:Sel1 repeat family protein n=1 Tax=Asticcacaulis biprosthecium C19 TaxID=715226 RepID=F4QTK6_9CAUL|nr:tetratricopeptide repeat protein [Asticcacaulis biprosthecium]EGF90076.1 sel1 repeat family protein [Asticcacaulis biprosthecium C19]